MEAAEVLASGRKPAGLLRLATANNDHDHRLGRDGTGCSGNPHPDRAREVRDQLIGADVVDPVPVRGGGQDRPAGLDAPLVVKERSRTAGTNPGLPHRNGCRTGRGDVCALLSTGYIDTLAPGTTPPLGIFWGCQYISAAQQKIVFSPFFPGGDQITNGIVNAQVIDDPNLQFWVQTGVSTGGNVTAIQAMVGMNAQYANGTPNQAAGLSGAYINLQVTPAVTAVVPASYPWRGIDWLGFN